MTGNMALTEAEARNAFEQLSVALREFGLGWVVTQVEEKIALGKVQTRKLPAREPAEFFEGFWEVREVREARGAPAKNSALFAVAQQYTSQERLEILLESIILAVPTVHDVAEQTFINFAEFVPQERLVFEPEAQVRESFALERDELRTRAEATETLVRLIDELRQGSFDADPADAPR
jgi:hypothetical protein